MTPSDIAEWLELEASILAHIAGFAGDAPHLAQAAATIRALEGRVAGMVEVLSNSQAGGIECRAQLAVAWAKLNIATEALEKITGDIYDEEEASEETIAAIALARIKETK